jgi:pyruvate dehydrogenase E2 component (dihydrolipoamide acetyltransferase)/2-oxoisovalerate dehydrogenase E2 component (dihydrolipoyl transacylase)
MPKIVTVTFPDIGEGVVEGEVLEWRKQVGDTLKQDEVVVLVMTDKATVELPAPQPGVLAKQYYQPGGIAIKGKPLYDIDSDDNGATEEQEAKVEELPPKAPDRAVPSASEPTLPKSESTRCVHHGKEALPKIRQLAKQLGISLDEVQGTGKNRRITFEDLGKHRMQATAQTGQQHTPPWQLAGDQELPLIGIKALMAKRMAHSKRQIPHFSYFEQVDATRLVQLRHNLKEKALRQNIHLTYMPFLMRALSICILKHPLLNSSLDAEHSKVILHSQQNFGVAIATELGLIVPVLKGIESMDIKAIICAYEELIQRAHSNKLLQSDMKEATLTISNFGSKISGRGLWATPVINPPEVAIVGVSRIHREPLVKNDRVVICDSLNISWSFDHRVIDGDAAIQISKTFCRLIENPASLL